MTLIFDNFPQILNILRDFHFQTLFCLPGLSKITGNCQRFDLHFSQIVEDCVSDCQILCSSRSSSRNSFSLYNPPLFTGYHLQ